MKHRLTDAERDRIVDGWVRDYGTMIQRTCALYLSDPSLGEDAAQETFLKAWRSAEQFEGRNGSKVSTWLTRIAINTCRDLTRTKWYKRVDSSVDIESILALRGDIAEEDRTLFMDVLKLPPKYKSVVLLHYYQDMTQCEIASTLNVSRSCVQSRLSKAISMLKIELEGDDER